MIEEVFENLVEQFSDPFTFLRELIQNAMDAGSNLVEVTVTYQADRERVVVAVTDTGEGMTQQIIQEQLTKLFASTKEQDFTKIGKFGIGFVSVFAIEPELVVVDTGRDGEFWRIGFDGSTDYKLLRLQEPVEGTTVKVYKKLPADQLQAFEMRCEATITYWCRYSDTQVNFNGRPLNQELKVGSHCQVRYEQPGTTVVVGPSLEHPAPFGLYNRGLTLKEGQQEDLPGVTYRIKSHYLEHTLTRDNVLHDENYVKAMKLLEKSVRTVLLPSLFERMRACAVDWPARQEEMNLLCHESSRLVSERRSSLPRELKELPILPCVDGNLRSLQDFRKSLFWEGAVYCDAEASEVTAELQKNNLPVLAVAPGTPLAHWVARILGEEPRQASRSVATPVVVSQPSHESFFTLTTLLVSLLSYGDTSVRNVRLADFHYPGSCVQHLACLAQMHANEPIRLFKRGFWRSLQRYPGVLLLNHRHPLVQKALLRARRDPDLAAFVLAKAALLQDGLPQDLEAKIVGRVWSQA